MIGDVLSTDSKGCRQLLELVEQTQLVDEMFAHPRLYRHYKGKLYHVLA